MVSSVALVVHGVPLSQLTVGTHPPSHVKSRMQWVQGTRLNPPPVEVHVCMEGLPTHTRSIHFVGETTSSK